MLSRPRRAPKLAMYWLLVNTTVELVPRARLFLAHRPSVAGGVPEFATGISTCTFVKLGFAPARRSPPAVVALAYPLRSNDFAATLLAARK